MLLLAARLGLRIEDIRDLKLPDIDWRSGTLTIVQNKTKEPLALPIPEEVGRAVIDYLKNGRPVTESRNVFVRHVPPYDGFSITSNLHNIMTKALSNAGIPSDHSCVKWFDYELTRYELKAADKLCHGKRIGVH